MEAELDALGEELELEEQEELDKHLLEVGPAVGLPEVPTAEPAKPAPARVRLQNEKMSHFTFFSNSRPGKRKRIQTWQSLLPGHHNLPCFYGGSISGHSCVTVITE